MRRAAASYKKCGLCDLEIQVTMADLNSPDASEDAYVSQTFPDV